jgi:hypothetical protein
LLAGLVDVLVLLPVCDISNGLGTLVSLCQERVLVKGLFLALVPVDLLFRFAGRWLNAFLIGDLL